MEGKKPRILCVDDLFENLRIRALLLQQFGCETFLAEDYQSAMRVFSENEIDLLLVDYYLANGRTGEEIALDIRMIRPDIPIIMLTGAVSLPESAYKCADEVLIKGTSSPKTLLDTIQKLLPDRSLRPRHPIIVTQTKPPGDS